MSGKFTLAARRAVAVVDADGRATTLAARMALAAVVTHRYTSTIATLLALAAVLADGDATAITTLAALPAVGALACLASRFTGDTPLAPMTVAVHLELRLDSAALTL